MICFQKSRSNPRASSLCAIVEGANIEALERTSRMREDLDKALINRTEDDKLLLARIQEILDIQHFIFVKAGLGQYSLYSQILQLLQLPLPRGLFCIDFDDTLLNLEQCFDKIHQCYHQPPPYIRIPFEYLQCPSSKHLQCYNGTSLYEWKTTLHDLNMRGFTNFLLTNRTPIFSEDEALCEMVYDDLAGLLQGTIFVCNLLLKGAVLRYIQHIFKEKCKNNIDSLNIFLFDDDQVQQYFARLWGFQVIEATRQMQRPDCEFILRMKAVHLLQPMNRDLSRPNVCYLTTSVTRTQLQGSFSRSPHF